MDLLFTGEDFAAFGENVDDAIGGIGRTNTDVDVSQTFNLGRGAGTTVFDFTFWEMDSWDDETFYITIDGERINLGTFNHKDVDREAGGQDGQFFVFVEDKPGKTNTENNGGSSRWGDEQHRVRITAEGLSGNVEIGFGSTLNQGIHDESWQVEDFRITRDSASPSVGGSTPHTGSEHDPVPEVVVPVRPAPDHTSHPAPSRPSTGGFDLWSNTFGNIGVEGRVVIGEGQRVLLDVSADVGSIVVDGGELVVRDGTDITLETDWIFVMDGGLFQVGTAADRHESDFTLVLTGDNPDRDIDLRPYLDGPANGHSMGGHTMGMIQNNDAFLMAMGENSRIEIYAEDAAKESWSQLRQTANAGDNILRLDEATGWEVGDRIAIASSSFNMNEAEEFTVTDVRNGGRDVVLDRALRHRHYGEIETYDNGQTGADFQEWEADLRAEVALLSRNVTLTGDENAHIDRFGGHLMVMEGATLEVSGAEFTRMGQEGIVGRYAAHWHLVGDATGQFIENSSFHHTYNKGFTVHGTDNTRLEDNVVYETIGHGIFLEDGSEIGNLIKDNLVFSTRAASERTAAIPTDHTNASNFWIEHPGNTLIGNHAAGADHAGFFIDSDNAPSGQSTGKQVDADFGDLVFRDNVAHSADRGVTIDGRIDPDTLEHEEGTINVRQGYTLENTTVYKTDATLRGGIWLRADEATVTNYISVDNVHGYFSFGGNLLEDSVFVAQSDGNAEKPPKALTHGARLYQTSSAIDNVHFDGYDKDKETAILVKGIARLAEPHALRDVTFADNVGDDNRLRWDKFEQNTRISQGAILDVNGSLTGDAGTILTPNRVTDARSAQSFNSGLESFVHDTNVSRLNWNTDVLNNIFGHR